MFSIEYNTIGYFTSLLSSSLHTSIDSEIFFCRSNEMKKIRSLYDGINNSSMDYCDSEQGKKSTEYDFLHWTFSKHVFLDHVSKSIIRYVKTIFTKLKRLDYTLAVIAKNIF